MLLLVYAIFADRLIADLSLVVHGQRQRHGWVAQPDDEHLLLRSRFRSDPRTPSSRPQGDARLCCHPSPSEVDRAFAFLLCPIGGQNLS